MITGCLPTEEKNYCQRFIARKYNKHFDGHATPHKNKIMLEVYTDEGTKHHNLKRHAVEFEEFDLGGNDR